MKHSNIFKILFLASLALFFIRCDDEIILPDDGAALKSDKSVKAPSEETAGNNLSFPVLWADGESKLLRGTMGTSTFEGTWWYVWGEDPIDPNYPVFSCEPSPSNPALCLDGFDPYSDGSPVYKAYIQKDLSNEWQAFNAIPLEEVNVDQIDWGDDLESVNWTIRSMVRAEVVLYAPLADYTYNVPLTEEVQFPMRHVFGWGSNEVHGVPTLPDTDPPLPDFSEVPGDIATVYSDNARFTIQKLNVDSLDELEEKLEWKGSEDGWEGTDGNEGIINPALLNQAIHEASDGPGYYNAEINVKGKVIYGYTWKVRNMNEGEGYYRLTFSLDARDNLNTFIDTNTTIILPDEVDDEGDDGNDTDRGGTAILDPANNLTYMDILIMPKNSGGGKGGGNSGGAGNGGSTGNDGSTGNGLPGGGKGGKK